MTKVVADNHYATITTNDFALVADLLNAWLYLHCSSFFLSYNFKIFFKLLKLFVSVSDTTSCKVIWT
jgi:hypothetical protein